MATIALPKNTRASRQAFINKLRSGNYEYRIPAPHVAAKQRRGNFTTDRWLPRIEDLQHRLLIEAQGPLVTYTDDGDFSSRDLTRWYVAEFVRLNHLTGE